MISTLKKMKNEIAYIALLVRDYDEAIDFYTTILNFRLIEDTRLSETKRWVLVQPVGSAGCCLLLAKAADDHQAGFIGNQSGGRVFLFMKTDNFHRDYESLRVKNVKFVREPVQEEWGMVAVFEDLYGNQWDLIESVEKD